MTQKDRILTKDELEFLVDELDGLIIELRNKPYPKLKADLIAAKKLESIADKLRDYGEHS